MRKMVKAALAATLVFGAAHAARADLTYQGIVGLPLNPTAELPPGGGIVLQGGYFNEGHFKSGGVTVGSGKYYGVHASGLLNIGGAGGLELNGGIDKFSTTGLPSAPGTPPQATPTPAATPTPVPTEVPLPTPTPGGGQQDTFSAPIVASTFEGSSDNALTGGGVLSALGGAGGAAVSASNLTKTGVAFGAKYVFAAPGEMSDVRLAAGMGYDGGLMNDTFTYLVATKSFAGPHGMGGKAAITGSLGLRYDHFADTGGVFGTTSSKASVYAGLEVPVTRDGVFSLEGEIQSKNNSFPLAQTPYSFGIRIHPKGQSFAAGVGIQRQGIAGDGGLYALITYQFSTSKH